MKPSHAKQKGVVLVVSLILLLLLTVIAITAATTSSLQSRMASNAQDMNLAFQSAESGLTRWMAEFNLSAAFDRALLFGSNNGTQGSASIDRIDEVRAENCTYGSVGLTGFTFTCYHLTSTSSAGDGTSVAQHQMGYLVREGQL
ncbi:PilX N-terminal domain-containing pilus assembly protein [Pseudomonas pohangensis]|uniref:PilX N-terminal domain-containing pilus assembly protein n=1 Tax=Pseudomonas pohangensis TaxID=364197 RepID=UPI0012FDA86C